MTVNQRIETLRALMRKRQVDVLYIPNADDHLSDEALADHYNAKTWLSGFTGDAGCLVVTDKEALLWTDGRYFTQAERELANSCVKLMADGQTGVPTAEQWLVEHTPRKGTLAFDGNVVASETFLRLQNQLKEKKAVIETDGDLAGEVWGDRRPALPLDKIWVLPVKYTGTSIRQRISAVRRAMKKKGADALVLTSLEDPCWLFNLRGSDVPCTPVPYAFALLTGHHCTYYINPRKVPLEVNDYLEKAGVTVKPYEAIKDDLSRLQNKTVWACLRDLNANLYRSLTGRHNKLINEESPVLMMRAVKNKVEIRNIKLAHVKDGVAMTRFMYWLKNNKEENLNEINVQDHLYDLRRQQEHYIEPSFPTICAYEANAAMMHYDAVKSPLTQVKREGLLLVDSGGTYLEGTTDITRTFAMGRLNPEHKKYYTLVLKGHIDLAKQKFLAGTTGQNLDILARGPLWNLLIDYQCGTGHGVGHVLAIHEGPHGISWGMRNRGRMITPLSEGMVVTDEPGVYFPGKLGVRHENELLVVKDRTNYYGTFLKFENLTYCPYDREAIDARLLDSQELAWLNDYHRRVYRTVSPYLDQEEKKWLRKATAEIRA